MKKQCINIKKGCYAVVACIAVFTGMGIAASSQAAPQAEGLEAGGKIYQRYCAKCHGKNGDGRGRVAPLYIKLRRPRPSNFTIGFYAIRPTAYLAAIIHDGGEAHSLSPSMPPFGDELSNQQILDVVTYLRSFSMQANKQD